jgi:hypothetical protein
MGSYLRWMPSAYVIVALFILSGCKPSAQESGCLIAPPEEISRRFENAQKVGAELSKISKLPSLELSNTITDTVEETFRAIPDNKAACQMLAQLEACTLQLNKMDALERIHGSVDKACNPPPPPPKRAFFTEDFSLHERDSYISKHGITVQTQFIAVGGEGFRAQVGASAQGPVEDMPYVGKGAQIPLQRDDCDSLLVTIRDITLSKPPGISEQELRAMGMAAEGLITRTVVGTISGKCNAPD